MQENNVIYEITQQMKDKDNLKKDINNAMELVSNMFKEKYMNKITSEFENKLKHIEKNPTKEINLLNAIKPFLSEENHINIDNTIKIMKNFSAMSLLKPKENIENNTENLVFINSANKDSSVKEDGVYDIDEGCLLGIENNKKTGFNPVIFLIFLMLFNN